MKKSDFNFYIDKYSLLFFNSLSDKNKRLYAVIESRKLGYYSVDEIARKYNMHKQTVRKGQKELLSKNLLPAEQVCVSGGGGRKKVKTTVNIVSTFLLVVNCYTARNSMKSGISWINLTCKKI